MTETDINSGIEGAGSEQEFIERIEKAYGLYKLSEVFLKDVRDDYGKLKIARLRLDFARHELDSLISEARDKGIRLDNNEIVKRFYFLE